MMNQPNLNLAPLPPNNPDSLDKWLSGLANLMMILLVISPQLAIAQTAGSAFGGITEFLRSITNLLIFEWGYYIGIITLAIQGYRWKTGRIDIMTLGGWGLGIALVFFAPNIVGDIRNRSGGAI